MFGTTYLRNVVTLQLTDVKCTGCSWCIKVCPHEVFVLSGNKVKIANKDNCMECGACALNCPEGALFVKSGVGCASGIINGILNNTEASCGCDSSCN